MISKNDDISATKGGTYIINTSPFKVRLRWLGAVLQYSGKLVVFLMSLNILMIIIHH